MRLLHLIVIIMILVSIWCVGIGTEVADASTTTIQPSFADAFVQQYYPTMNYGSNVELGLSDYTGWVARSLLKFDTSSIDEAAVIYSATLSVYLSRYNSTYDAAKTIDCKRVTSAWDESTVTWSNQPSTTDTDKAQAATVHATTGWVNFNVLALVNDAIDNRGDILDVCLRLNVETGSVHGSYYHSNNYTSNTSLCPELVIVIIGTTPTPGPTPEPTPESNTIVCLGDSLTYGYPSYNEYENYLQGLLSGDWDVINKGVAGDTTAEMYARLETDVIDLNPEYCIVWGGINDISWGYNHEQIEGNLSLIYSDLSDAGIYVLAMEITEWNDISASQQVVLDLVNSWLVGEAADVDGLVELYHFLEDASNPDRLAPVYDSGDGVHLSVAGYDKVGLEAYNVLMDVPEPTATPTVTPDTGGEALADINVTMQSWMFMALAVCLTFLSLKLGAFMWFISLFAWIGLAAYAGGEWLGPVASVMAIFCVVMFILSAGTKKGRRTH